MITYKSQNNSVTTVLIQANAKVRQTSLCFTELRHKGFISKVKQNNRWKS